MSYAGGLANQASNCLAAYSLGITFFSDCLNPVLYLDTYKIVQGADRSRRASSWMLVRPFGFRLVLLPNFRVESSARITRGWPLCIVWILCAKRWRASSRAMVSVGCPLIPYRASVGTFLYTGSTPMIALLSSLWMLTLWVPWFMLTSFGPSVNVFHDDAFCLAAFRAVSSSFAILWPARRSVRARIHQ